MDSAFSSEHSYICISICSPCLLSFLFFYSCNLADGLSEVCFFIPFLLIFNKYQNKFCSSFLSMNFLSS